MSGKDRTLAKRVLWLRHTAGTLCPGSCKGIPSDTAQGKVRQDGSFRASLTYRRSQAGPTARP